MKCLICKTKIKHNKDFIQHATEFVGGGDYGSVVTDDNSRYSIFVCDPCMREVLKDKQLFKNYYQDVITKVKRTYIK